MAIYTVSHSCGHDQTHTLFGPSRGREQKLAWLADQPCLDCVKKDRDAERDAESQRAAELAQAEGLPALTGTPKQVAWAETIRRTYLDSPGIESDPHFQSSRTITPRNLSDSACLAIKRLVEPFELGAPESKEKVFSVLTAAEDLLAGLSLQITDARWWIDHRTSIAADVRARFYNEMNQCIIGICGGDDISAAQADAEHKAELDREAAILATLRPTNATTTHIAVVKVHLRRVSITLDEKHEGFRDVVKALGYRWDASNRVWGTVIPAYMDISIELAHLIAGCLEAGVGIECHDEIARHHAATELPRRQLRWITLTDHGRIFIRHEFGNDALYNLARRLPGASWSRALGGVVLSPSGFAQIRDFADRNGFSISAKADYALTLAQEQYEAVPTAVPAKTKATVETDSVTPRVLDYDKFEPDPDLLDDIEDTDL